MLNFRLLVTTIAVVALLAPALYAIHRLQFYRNADTLFERAIQLERDGKYSESATTAHQYLSLRPDDAEARVFVAQVYDKTANNPASKERAAELYQVAVGHFATRLDLRSRLAEILLELNRLEESERECLRLLSIAAGVGELSIQFDGGWQKSAGHVQKAISENPLAASIVRTLANAKYRQFVQGQPVNSELLLQLVRSALAANPHDLELMLTLAKVTRGRPDTPGHKERAAQANDELTMLVATHPDRAKSNLALHDYRVNHRLQDAEQPLNEALLAAPDDYEVLLAAARHAAATADQADKAAEYFQRAIRGLPDRSDAYVGLSELRLRQGQAERAIEHCRQAAISLGEHNLDVNITLVRALLGADRLSEVEPVLFRIKHRLEEISPLLDRSDRIRLKESVMILQADYCTATGKWLDAIQILRPLAMSRSAERTLDQDEQSRADRWRRLGWLYGQLEAWDLSARAYEQQSELDHEPFEASLNAGSAWLRGGRSARAIEHLQSAVQQKPAESKGWMRLASVELHRQMQSQNQDWSEFDRALAAAARTGKNEIELERLRIQALLAKGLTDEAARQLELSLGDHPVDQSRFAVAVFQALGKLDRAAECLEQLRTMSGSPTDVAEAEADYYLGLKDHDRAMQALRSAISTSPKLDRYRLQKRLALCALEFDDQSASGLLMDCAKEHPNDPWPLVQLAEQSLTKNDLTALAEYSEKLLRVEGQGGTLWRFYRGMAATLSENHQAQTNLREARRLHAELESLRPAWPATHQLRGQIARHEGRLQDAAAAYREAIEAGARSLSVFEGLITLLYSHYQWAEADDYLARLRDVGHSSAILESFSPRLLVKVGEYDRAVRAARAGVQFRLKDPLAHLWLGQTLTIAAEFKEDDQKLALMNEAEHSFQEAAKLAPEDYRVWGGMLWFYLRTGQVSQAKVAVVNLQDRAKLSDVQRALALGQAHHLLGELSVAEEHFLKAARLLPNDVAVYEKLAEFYLSHSPRKAEAAYRKLLRIDPRSQLIKRSLATLLAAKGTPESLDEAIKLLASGAANEADRRLQVLLQVRQGTRKELLEAKRLLQGQGNVWNSSSAADRLLCALVCEALGEVADAHDHLKHIVRGKQSPEYLGILADFELRHRMFDEAEANITSLLEIDPRSASSIALRARWLKASGKPDSLIAEEVIKWRDLATAQATIDHERERLAIVCADILGQLTSGEQAERAYQHALNDHDGLESRRAFALWLVKQGRTKEAINLVFEAAQTAQRSSPTLQLLGNLLTIGASRGLEFAAAEELLRSSAMESHGDATLLLELATLRHMQGRSSEAKSLYQAAAQVAPNHVLIHNNLAVVLAEQTETVNDALTHIEQALALAGPQAELRDTHAIVLGHLGRHDEARQILKALISRAPSNARYHFHLAQVEFQANEIESALASLEIAQQHRLSDQLLTPYERKTLSQILKLMPTAATTAANSARTTAARTAK